MITIIWLLGNPKHDSDLLLRSEGKWMSKVRVSLNTLIVTERHSDSAQSNPSRFKGKSFFPIKAVFSSKTMHCAC